MELDQDGIKRIAHLARLGIDGQDVDGYVRDLSSILHLVEQLQAVDTAGIEPLAHPLDAEQRLRADVVSEDNQREQLQAGAPQAENGLFLVPRVIE